MKKHAKILNSVGEEVKLNVTEAKIANALEKHVNALGYEIDITSLTTIMKSITEQKFFELAPADYMPVKVGEGAWGQQLTTYRSFSIADAFETGIINSGANNGRLAGADAGVDAINVQILNWAKQIGWTLFDVQMASKSGNWDLIVTREKARKKNWDLGIQKIAFLGGPTGVLGILNQSGITNNTTRITKKISTMTGIELKAFCAGVLDDYRTNCARSAWPTHFIVPESDYLGLAAPSSPDYPLKSVLQVLTETFATMTKKPGFQILPCAYGDTAYGGPATACRYVLLNYDEESVRMDIPVDYNNTLANSTDNFSFQNVGYGQFTGVQAYRPKEMLYFSF